MSPRQTNEEVVRQYALAASVNDLDGMTALRAPDWRVTWPQSGEMVVDDEDFRAIVDNYPGGSPRTEMRLVVGDVDRWVVSPSGTVLPKTRFLRRIR